MKIVVIGGTGLIGKKLISILTERGHDVTSASRSAGVDVLTGEGLSEALSGAETVVDVLNSPSFEDTAVLEFFKTAGAHLLKAEAAAGVAHHVALSVVGIDRIPNGYFRAKLAQEALITAGTVPYTIVRATQFFEFAPGIAQFSTVDGAIHLNTAPMQPIAADDVALFLANTAEAKPVNSMIELAGPERIPLDAFVLRYLAATKDPRPTVTNPAADYFGAPLDDQGLAPGANPRLASTTYADWLNRLPV